MKEINLENIQDIMYYYKKILIIVSETQSNVFNYHYLIVFQDMGNSVCSNSLFTKNIHKTVLRR